MSEQPEVIAKPDHQPKSIGGHAVVPELYYHDAVKECAFAVVKVKF